MKMHWLFLLLFLISCGRDSKPAHDEYITIGGLFPLTGEFCNEGIRALNGLQLARQVINENGGVLGKKLDVIVLDDRNDAKYAIEQYNVLKKKGVVAIVGSSFPEVTQALIKATEEDGMPMISPTIVNPTKAKVLASFARNTLSAKTALIVDDAKYDSTTNLFEEEFKLNGGIILGHEDFNSPEDFENILKKYRATQPDIIFCQTNYIAAAKLAETAHKLGIDKSKFIGTYAWEGILGFLYEEEITSRIYYASPFALDEEDEQIKEFAHNFFANYRQMPVSASALSYSSVQILVAAIDSAKSTEPKDIISTMSIIDPNIVAKHSHQTIYIMEIKNNIYSLFKKLNL
ncbi:MAG: ABC transporter substrate-binding protein [Fibromonadales bacterium]|nr:ABC transporter substrate-binding protein [Fibromonadales bacterium]